MKFYISGKLEDSERVLNLMRQLEDMGHKVTHKWPLEQANTADKLAAFDMRGVINCHVFVALFDKPLPFLNAYVELGIALAYEKRVIIVGRCDTKCIFTELKSVTRLDNIDQFIKLAKSMDKESSYVQKSKKTS